MNEETVSRKLSETVVVSNDDLFGSIAPDHEAPGRYIHVGCFADDRTDRVLGHMLTHNDMTAAVRTSCN